MKIIKSFVPSAEISDTFSGSEAVMNAIRIATAHTRKDKVLKFEGHHRGAHDYTFFQ
jgi:glutamate-1-semialdehyde 2,1-aminomutase